MVQVHHVSAIRLYARWALACLSRLYAAIFEEIPEQFGGFGFEDALFDGDCMVEAFVCGGIVEAPCVAGFRVGGGVDEAIYAGGVGGAGAHGARFQGGVEGATAQTPAARSLGGLADSEELGVGGGVVGGFALVGGDGQDLFSPGDHGAHGDLAPCGGALGGEQGAAHHGVIRGCRREFGVLVHEDDNSREAPRERRLPPWLSETASLPGSFPV